MTIAISRKNSIVSNCSRGDRLRSIASICCFIVIRPFPRSSQALCDRCGVGLLRKVRTQPVRSEGRRSPCDEQNRAAPNRVQPDSGVTKNSSFSLRQSPTVKLFYPKPSDANDYNIPAKLVGYLLTK